MNDASNYRPPVIANNAVNLKSRPIHWADDVISVTHRVQDGTTGEGDGAVGKDTAFVNVDTASADNSILMEMRKWVPWSGLQQS